jgi:hypothetical protein
MCDNNLSSTNSELKKNEYVNRHTIYYHNNKNKIIQKAKDYYKENRDELLNRMKEKVECDKCKSIVSRNKLARHKKSKKCSETEKIRNKNNKISN